MVPRHHTHLTYQSSNHQPLFASLAANHQPLTHHFRQRKCPLGWGTPACSIDLDMPSLSVVHDFGPRIPPFNTKSPRYFVVDLHPHFTPHSFHLPDEMARSSSHVRKSTPPPTNAQGGARIAGKKRGLVLSSPAPFHATPAFPRKQ